ncbi:MAG: NifU family protein [Myxococcota bacterium]
MDEIEELLVAVARPLIEADGGTLEVLSLDGDQLTVQLGGSYRGCPGLPVVRASVLEPLASRAAGRPIRVKTVF